MLHKNDSIFWAATSILLISLVLAIYLDQAFLLLMLSGYLLRPTLHSLGFARKLIDERQLLMQYRASNVGFATLVLGNVVAILALMAKDNHAWEMLVAALLVAVAARALSRLFMDGDWTTAVPRVLTATGMLLCLFGALESGLSLESLQHILPGLFIAGLGWLGRWQQRATSIITFVLATVITVGLSVFAARSLTGPNWGTAVAGCLLVVPLLVAETCLWRSGEFSHE